MQLSSKTHKALVEKKITAGHARVLIGLDEKNQQLMVNSIIGQKLSVRDVELMIKNKKEIDPSTNPSTKTPQKATQTYNFDAILNKLDSLDIKCKTSQNKITLEFSSQDEIEDFLAYFQ